MRCAAGRDGDGDGSVLRHAPDLVIGADLFYDCHNLDDILVTVDAFFDINRDCVCIVAYQERGGTLDAVLAALAMWHMKATTLLPVRVDDGSDFADDERFVSTKLIAISRQQQQQ